MKRGKKVICTAVAAIMVLGLAACGSSSVPENTIFTVDDMVGKKIGVQLGTTGDIYASDFAEEEGEGTTVEQYSKGADAIQSLKQGKVDCVIIDR